MMINIPGLFSDEVRQLYDAGSVSISGIDRDRLSDLGFERMTFRNAELFEIWVHEVPDTFRFVHYLAVVIDPEGRDNMLMGITDRLLSRQGWKAEPFAAFCYTVHFRDPEGNYENDAAIRYIDAKVREMMAAGIAMRGVDA